MLNVSKNVTLNGSAEINGKTIATMYANIGNGFDTNTNIIDKELYELNKDEAMANINEFNRQAFETFEKTLLENEAETK